MLFSEGLTKSGRKTDVALRLRSDYIYTAIVVSTLLYGSETWPMTVANRRRLEAARHRCLRRILFGVSKSQRTGQELGYGEHHQEEKTAVARPHVTHRQG